MFSECAPGALRRSSCWTPARPCTDSLIPTRGTRSLSPKDIAGPLADPRMSLLETSLALLGWYLPEMSFRKISFLSETAQLSAASGAGGAGGASGAGAPEAPPHQQHHLGDSLNTMDVALAGFNIYL